MGRHYTQLNKEQVVEAIKGSHGIMTTIAKRLNCYRGTAKKYVEKYSITRQMFHDEKQAFGDICELAGIKQVMQGDTGMIKFFLSTLFRDRGFVEKQMHEHTGKDGGEIKIDNSDNKSAEVLDILIQCGAFKPKVKNLDNAEAE